MSARWMVRAMLRVSAFGLLDPVQELLEALRGFHSPAGDAARVQAAALACLPHDAPGAVDVGVELARARDPDLRAPPRLGHLGQQLADAVVERVDLMGGAAVAQRRPHEQVDEQADGDADAGVEQPRQEHARVVARAGGQHHERGGRRGRGLGPQPAHRAGDQADEDREPERQRVEAEDAPERERDEHAEYGGADLLDAAAQRAVDGRMDGEQRGPRGEERLLDVEHVDREHPRDDRREDRLDDLQRVRPPHRIPELSAHAEPS